MATSSNVCGPEILRGGMVIDGDEIAAAIRYSFWSSVGEGQLGFASRPVSFAYCVMRIEMRARLQIMRWQWGKTSQARIDLERNGHV